MISKEVKQFLKEKGRKDNGKYFVSFVEEFWMPDTEIFPGIRTKKKIDFIMGRIEIWADDYEYDIEEIRFKTKDEKGFAKFREKWDFKDISAEQLDELERITKKLYQK